MHGTAQSQDNTFFEPSTSVRRTGHAAPTTCQPSPGKRRCTRANAHYRASLGLGTNGYYTTTSYRHDAHTDTEPRRRKQTTRRKLGDNRDDDDTFWATTGETTTRQTYGHQDEALPTGLSTAAQDKAQDTTTTPNHTPNGPQPGHTAPTATFLLLRDVPSTRGMAPPAATTAGNTHHPATTTRPTTPDATRPEQHDLRRPRTQPSEPRHATPAVTRRGQAMETRGPGAEMKTAVSERMRMQHSAVQHSDFSLAPTPNTGPILDRGRTGLGGSGTSRCMGDGGRGVTAKRGLSEIIQAAEADHDFAGSGQGRQQAPFACSGALRLHGRPGNDGLPKALPICRIKFHRTLSRRAHPRMAC